MTISKIGYLFPGQGSQCVGMGKELCKKFLDARKTFEEANDALGFDLRALCFEGPEEVLRMTENAQPAILTMSIAALRVSERESGMHPDLLAGHSLGEYSALVASSSLKFFDAVRIARKRGAFMQEAVPKGKGSMAAILGMKKEKVKELCHEVQGLVPDSVVSPANFNTPEQIVISGHTGAVEAAVELAQKRGAKRCILLNVSAPFHCALMEPAGLRLKDELDKIVFGPMKVPIVSNVTAGIVTNHEDVKPLLVQQVSRPVLWEECIKTMVNAGIGEVIELGPGRVLSGFMKRIAPSLAVRDSLSVSPCRGNAL